MLPAIILLVVLALRHAGKEKEAVDYLNSVLPGIPRDSEYYQLARYYLTPRSDGYIVSLTEKEKDKECHRVEVENCQWPL